MRKRPSGVRLHKAERERVQGVFLESFAVSANITAACKRAGVSRQTMYQWQEHDETFSLRYKQAEAEAQDVIRAAVHEHAVRGWDEPVISMGHVVYVGDKPLMLHKYDSSLLAKLAAARLPEFREKVDINATVQGNLSYDLNLPDDPEAASLARALIRRITSGGVPESGSAGLSRQ